LFIAFLCTLSSFAQNVVRGTVSDSNGQPLPGAYVGVKGTTNGRVTDVNGKFSIQAGPKDVLTFNCIGMAAQEIKVGNQQDIQVTLKDDVAALDEVVVVGYGTQKRGSITGAISTVSDKEILKAPTMSISNIVGSRIAGVAAVQSSGQPGADNAALTMRGQSGIIYVIDGIRRTVDDFNGLDPNEIESVSILKDASAVAIYGLDANGAFIVTTKKGHQDKMTITYTGSTGISRNAEQQVWLDGPGYAYWYNKAREMDGDPIVFSADMIRKMREGVDGWGNTNWYKKYFGTGHRTHHNLNATGGSDRVHFFASLGYLKEKGNIDKYNYDRLNLRSNIDAKLTKSLTFTLGVSGRVEMRDQPRYSADPDDWHNLPQQIIRALPYVPETYEYQGKVYPVSTRTASSPIAPSASIYDSGYSNSTKTYVQSNFSLKYDAPWLKGLSFKFQGAYDVLFSFRKVLSIPYEVMLADLPTASTTKLTYQKAYDAVGNNTGLSEAASKAYTFTTQTSVSYDNKFGKHSVGALFLAETREYKSNQLSATGTGLDFIQLDELDNIMSSADFLNNESKVDELAEENKIAEDTQAEDLSVVPGISEENKAADDFSVDNFFLQETKTDTADELPIVPVEEELEELPEEAELEELSDAEPFEDISIPSVDDILRDVAPASQSEPNSSGNDHKADITDKFSKTDSTSETDDFFKTDVPAEDTSSHNAAFTDAESTAAKPALKTASQNTSSSLPANLTEEIKSVLLYMDQLLEDLPEEKIVEFARSEQFATYKKLFSDLGLS